jgi:DNA-binding LacI/PurR family transcriptional regulator
MGRPPTLSDIARACSVSVATASKALSPHLDRCDLSPETRAKVLAMAHELGWSRDHPRSARARRRWHNIGVLWGYRNPTLGSYEFVPETLATVLGDAYRLLITPVPEPRDWRELQLSLRLDGVIVLGQIDDAILADLEASDYPAVLVNLRTPRRLPQVIADDFAGTSAAVQHLVELGHRRIVYLRNTWEPGHYSEVERLRAVVAGTAAAGASWDDVRGRDYAAVIARCRAGATAVICNNFWDVAGLYAALEETGLAIPAAVSVVACHDLSWFARFAPPVTGVVVPTRQMAEKGAHMLLQLMAGQPLAGERQHLLPEVMVLRGSTGPVS